MTNTAPSTADVVRQLKQILVHDLLLNVTADEIADDYSLLEDGLALDSIVIEELIALTEDRFGVQFDDRVLNTELFANLSVFAAFVAEECLAAKSKQQPRSGVSPC